MTTNAKYAGLCKCGQPVVPGMPIVFEREQRPQIRQCPACAPALPPEEPPVQIKAKVVRVNDLRGDWGRVEVRLEEVPADCAMGPGESCTAVGSVGEPAVGDVVEFYGLWRDHPRFGRQFLVSGAQKVVAASLEALEAFLECLPNVGESRARAIIAKFKTREAVQQALESGEGLEEIKGITPLRAQAISRAYREEAHDLREVHVWLAGLKLGQGTTAKIIKAWQKEARTVLEADPYALMTLKGIKFKTADEHALNAFKIAANDPRRAAAAVQYLLTCEEEEGHTWTNLYELVGYPALSINV